MVDHSFTIQTAHLRLRFPVAEDNHAIFAATRIPGFTDGLQWDPPASLDFFDAYLQKVRLAWNSGQAYVFSIDRIQDGQFCGRITIRRNRRHSSHWTLGYFTLPDFQGRGVMTEAVGAIVNFGFRRLGAQHIEADYATWNTASGVVLWKNGFRWIGFTEKGFRKNDQWVPEYQVSLSRIRWWLLKHFRLTTPKPYPADFPGKG